MIRFFAISSSLSVLLGCGLVLSGCGDRTDLFVAWTVDGADAAEGCAAFKKPTIEANIVQKNAGTDPDARIDEGVDERVELSCADAAGTIPVARFASVMLELLSGGDAYAVSSDRDISVKSNSTYPGESADNPMRFDLHVIRSTLNARLTVVGADCGDAGVNSFSVTLLKNVAPLQDDVVVDGEEVSCSDGVATFSFAPVDVGSVYKVVATAAGFATEPTGEGVEVDGAQTSLVVDLRAE
jgi:hypothetical protein